MLAHYYMTLADNPTLWILSRPTSTGIGAHNLEAIL